MVELTEIHTRPGVLLGLIVYSRIQPTLVVQTAPVQSLPRVFCSCCLRHGYYAVFGEAINDRVVEVGSFHQPP